MKIQIDKQIIEQVLDALEMNWAVIDTATKQEAITALRSALESAESLEQKPVRYEFQCSDGKWHPFIDDRHYENTVADGSWPIRALYTHPAPAVPEVGKYREALEMARGVLKDWSDYGGTYMPEHTHTDSIWQDTDSAIEKIEEVLK